MATCKMRDFRYIAFPPIVFETPVRSAVLETASPEAELLPEPDIIAAVPEPIPAVVEPVPAEPPPVIAMTPVQIAVRQGPPPVAEFAPAVPVGGLRRLAEFAAAAAPPPEPRAPAATTPRFALLNDIAAEMRPRRARTGRRTGHEPK